MRWISGFRWRAAALAALFVAGLVPVIAVAQTGILLNRDPSPPQAILQTGQQALPFTVTYNTNPTRLRLRIFNPLNSPIFDQEFNSGNSNFGPSSFSSQSSFNPGGAGAPLGRYRAQLDFFATPAPDANPEASANVAFDVADALGTLQLLKCEDLNGNGICDPGEPRLPNWTFRLTNPQGNSSVVTTGPGRSITIPNVPAGVWTVTEVMEPGFVPISPPSGEVTVPANGVGTFAAANARPANICGVVFLDANRNGQLDPGEEGFPGAPLALGGTQQASGASGPGGQYCFEALRPGVYSVTVTVPPGLENTTPVTIPNIVLRSGVDSNNNNFGLAPPVTVRTTGDPAPRPPTPDVRIGKRAPRQVPIEATFDYRIVVRNNSNFTARRVVVTDLIPMPLTLVRIPAGATVRNGVVTWPLGNLPRGATRSLTMRVRVNPQFTGVIPNTATVTAQGLGPRRSTARTRVVGPPPVQRTGGVTG